LLIVTLALLFVFRVFNFAQSFLTKTKKQFKMDYRKPVAERDYNFSDGLLEQLADRTRINITRDLAVLAARGVTTTTISNLETLTETFKDSPDDTDARGSVTVSVEDKDLARDTVLIQARTLRTAAQNKFGLGTGKYNRFGFEGIDKVRDADLTQDLKRTYRVGLNLQSFLASEGIDATFLSNYLLAIKAYDDSFDNVGAAVDERNRITEERCTAGNTLYKEIVRLCNIGKDYFSPISEANYNDYVIDNFVGNSAVNVLAVYEDFISASSLVNLGTLPVAGKIFRFIVIAGGPLEIGLSIDGTTFNGNTVTLASAGTETILITDLNSTGTIILVRNQNGTVQGNYKIEVLG
jgi:hypothetical protein